MNITSKSRYGLKIMMDLATIKAAHTQRLDIATRQGIPLDYMDHILLRLRTRGLIGSIRGRGGGYRLLQPMEGISVWEIFDAVEDAIQPVQCLEGGTSCAAEHHCSSRDAWSDIAQAVKNSLSAILLSDIVTKRRIGASFLDETKLGLRPEVGVAASQGFVQECRAPKRRQGLSEESMR